MLMAPCGGAGFGGGIGGGCGDCNGTYKLTQTPRSFGVLPMNKYVRFHHAGTYNCQASSADITTAPLDETFRPVLPVRSSPIMLTIVNDPVWARSAAIAYADAYRKASWR